MNSFVLNAAIDKAKQIMAREGAFKLSQRDATLQRQSVMLPFGFMDFVLYQC
jgi:uncharacterized protein (DUF1778 family)